MDGRGEAGVNWLLRRFPTFEVKYYDDPRGPEITGSDGCGEACRGMRDDPYIHRFHLILLCSPDFSETKHEEKRSSVFTQRDSDGSRPPTYQYQLDILIILRIRDS